MKPPAVDWSVAYARQARSDLDARDCLIRCNHLPHCHELQFLQMATEKICKASLAQQGSSIDALRRSHAHIAKTLPQIVRQLLSRQSRQIPTNAGILGAIRKLARQIELLAPAVDDAGRTPSNCEYPWAASDGQIIIPAEHQFGFTLLYERSGRTLLKLLRQAADEYDP